MNFLRNTKRLFNIYFGKMTIEKRLLFSHVERDWAIMFTVFVLMLLIVTFLSVSLFLGVSKENLIVENADNGRQTQLDKKELEETVNFFENKKEKFETLKKDFFEVPDPMDR